jgi:hypothetical protein
VTVHVSSALFPGVPIRAGSISIIFVDVDYRFFSIIFDDFGFDVDFLYNRDFDFDFFSQSCIYGFGDHVRDVVI